MTDGREGGRGKATAFGFQSKVSFLLQNIKARVWVGGGGGALRERRSGGVRRLLRERAPGRSIREAESL